MIYIGIDNGVTGSIGIIDENGVAYQFATPVYKDLNYQKTKVKHITRIHFREFKDKLIDFLYPGGNFGHSDFKVVARVAIERPMVNPQRFDATVSALRALEATLIVLESLGVGKEYCDSKSWQKMFLPYIKVTDKKKYPAKLKEVSLEVGKRMYPNIEWDGFKDADGILIATWLKQKYSGVEI